MTSGKDAKTSPDAIQALETLLEHIADEDLQQGQTPDEIAWARTLRKDMDARLAALRRRRLPPRSLPRRPARVSDELLALDRETLLVRLENLRQAPGVRFAYLEFSELTTEDLRQLIAELEAIEKTLT